MLAWVYFTQKNFREARKHTRIALRTGSKDPEPLREADAIKMAKGNVDLDNRLVAKALKTNPTFAL